MIDSTLNGKRAIVFGAGGSIGAAVAKAFAFESAEVFAARAPREQTIIVTGEHGPPVERTFWTDTHIC